MRISQLYPEIEPWFTQRVAVSSQHSLYVERSGKQGGYPIFFLHGGPGSQSRAVHRRYFDPDFFDIVLFDQRGCGKSLPAGETQDNHTAALVEDINTLREALGIHRKISVLGGSWGSTLALAFALRYPQWLDALILRGVFLGSEQELAWYTHGLARFAPEAWSAFSSGLGDDLIAEYYAGVHAADQQHAMRMAKRWADYELQLMGMVPGPLSMATLHSARVQLHFLKHRCFLADYPLLNAAPTIQLPVSIVQGRLDLVCPPLTAWRLSQALPQATLRIVADAGHSALTGSLALALKNEVDTLRDRLRGT